jgi:hypothetical protein
LAGALVLVHGVAAAAFANQPRVKLDAFFSQIRKRPGCRVPCGHRGDLRIHAGNNFAATRLGRE